MSEKHEMEPLNQNNINLENQSMPLANNGLREKLGTGFCGLSGQKWLIMAGVFGLITVIIGMVVLIPFGNQVDADDGFNPVQDSLDFIIYSIDYKLEEMLEDLSLKATIMEKIKEYVPSAILNSAITSLVCIAYASITWGVIGYKPDISSNANFIKITLITTLVLLMVIVVYWLIWTVIISGSYFWLGSAKHGVACFLGFVFASIWIYIWTGIFKTMKLL